MQRKVFFIIKVFNNEYKEKRSVYQILDVEMLLQRKYYLLEDSNIKEEEEGEK